MKNYDERIESILRKYDERLAKEKRRKALILRSCAVGVGAAAVLGIGLTTYALRPPKKPAPSQSGIIVETETTSAETTAAPTSPSTAAPRTTTAAQTTDVTTAATTSSARKTTSTVRSTESYARTTRTAVATTAAVQTTAPITTTAAPPTTEDIEQRIANIVLKMPDMLPMVQDLPVVNENGERIPTFPMLLADDRYYLLILNYLNGEANFTADFNDDGVVNLNDALELEMCKYCCDYKTRWKEYPRDFDELFPDTDVFDRAAAYKERLFGSRDKYFLTYYLIYTGVDIPGAEGIEEIAREYAGERPVPDSVYSSLSDTVGGIRDEYNANYEKRYKLLNEDKVFSDYELAMFKKIDSGELFPDADRDGVIGYMDCYTMLRFYAYMSTENQSFGFTDDDVEWILGHCDLDNWNYVNAKDVSHLLAYLFYYKKYDYVTYIEMEMEFKASQDRQ